MFAAAGGLFLAATTTAGDATVGDVFVLTSIAAVVLGGISFFGGRGSAIGTVAGAFVLTLLINVLFFASIDPLYQSFFQGLFLDRRGPARDADPAARGDAGMSVRGRDRRAASRAGGSSSPTSRPTAAASLYAFGAAILVFVVGDAPPPGLRERRQASRRSS